MHRDALQKIDGLLSCPNRPRFESHATINICRCAAMASKEGHTSDAQKWPLRDIQQRAADGQLSNAGSNCHAIPTRCKYESINAAQVARRTGRHLGCRG